MVPRAVRIGQLKADRNGFQFEICHVRNLSICIKRSLPLPWYDFYVATRGETSQVVSINRANLCYYVPFVLFTMCNKIKITSTRMGGGHIPHDQSKCIFYSQHCNMHAPVNKIFYDTYPIRRVIWLSCVWLANGNISCPSHHFLITDDVLAHARIFRSQQWPFCTGGSTL